MCEKNFGGGFEKCCASALEGRYHHDSIEGWWEGIECHLRTAHSGDCRISRVGTREIMGFSRNHTFRYNRVYTMRAGPPGWFQRVGPNYTSSRGPSRLLGHGSPLSLSSGPRMGGFWDSSLKFRRGGH